MKPILKLSLAIEGREEMLCLLKRGDEVDGEDDERSSSNDESKRRERSLSATRSGRSLDDWYVGQRKIEEYTQIGFMGTHKGI